MLRPDLCGDYRPRGVVYDPLTFATLALTAVGTAVSAVGTLAAGDAQQQAANYRAQQQEMAAKEAQAADQRQAFEQQRKTDLTLSTLQARAASQGSGDTTDDNVVKLGSDIAGRGEYQALMELFGGENRSRGLNDQAKASRYDGEVAKIGSQYSAAGTLLNGLGSGFSRYAAASGKLPSADSLRYG